MNHIAKQSGSGEHVYSSLKEGNKANTHSL